MKKNIKLPDNWNEVTIGQYQEIVNIETEDSTRRWVEIIAILSNEDPELVKCMEVTKFTQAITHLSFILTLPEDKIFKDEIVINGVTYKFKERLEELTLGEWIDLEAYIEDTNVNLHKTFATLYKGEDGTFENKARLFQENVMIGDVYAALLFFSLIGNESMKTIKDYLTLEVERMTTLEEETTRMKIEN